MARSKPAESARAVTISEHSKDLYVIPCGGGGYSCLGFDVMIERYNRLAAELMPAGLGQPTYLGSLPRQFPPQLRGTLEGYAYYRELLELGQRDGRRFMCELSPQLVGLEGHRVEVTRTDANGRTSADRTSADRFIVGKSTGWLPCHLEIARVNSSGGGAADRQYKRVRDLGRVR